MQLREVKHYRERKAVSPSKCKQLIRFESDSVDFLCNQFIQDRDESRGGALSSRMRMELFLRYVSDPGFQSGVAEDFGIHRTTVGKNFTYVMDNIFTKAHNWIRFPRTPVDINGAKLLWQTRFKIPTVIGAVDCTHIEIQKPHQFGDEYVNRKGYSSLNVQMTCDAAEKITSVDAQWPGSVHDSRIWKLSSVCRLISEFNGSACLLGDSGYGIAPWMITPFKNPTTTAEMKFNTLHSKERVIIERIFGQLKKRFPILGNVVRIPSEKIPKLIVCCAVLHNVAKHLNDSFECELPVTDNPDYVEPEVNEGNIKERGELKRSQLLQSLNLDV